MIARKRVHVATEYVHRLLYRGVDEGEAEVKKKPDLLVTLAVLIGMGVLVTELAYGMMNVDSRPVQTQASYYVK